MGKDNIRGGVLRVNDCEACDGTGVSALTAEVGTVVPCPTCLAQPTDGAS